MTDLETAPMLRIRWTPGVCCAAIVVAAGLFGKPSAAIAQETREAIIAAAQAQKASQLAPYTPNKAEAALEKAFDLLTLPPNGFYPVFGSVYSGGGFTLGGGYRHYVSERSVLSLSGLYSIKNYKLVEARLHRPSSVRQPVEFAAKMGWRDATQIAYHGLGIDSPEDRAEFRMKQGYGGGETIFRPRPWAIFAGALTYEGFTIEEGTGSRPPVQEVHTPATAPGLGANPDYLHLDLSAALDTRPSPGYARRGLLYQLTYRNYNDLDNAFSFDRLDAEIVHHIPIFRENWVISLHGRLESTLGDTDVVPFFLLPSLGSGSTLRGFSSWRFRDKHAVLFSGEYRWTPSRLVMDAALFYDAGTVASEFDRLRLDKMEHDFGFGVRFHTLISTPLRIEVAKSSEGLRLVFAGSAAF
jgi:surface antigen Omp85-like protein